ncbi:hypothetical protein ILUMI_03286, partial [Ignelater luminosus]
MDESDQLQTKPAEPPDQLQPQQAEIPEDQPFPQPIPRRSARVRRTPRKHESVQYYYCGQKTFSVTTVSVSRNIDFVTDITADSKQNLTTDSTSFTLDVTGCVTPIGELKDAIGIEIQFKNLPNIYNGGVQNLLLLYMLKMEYCDIKELHPGAFLQLPSINTIFLRFNRIERIDEGVFNNLKVVKLYLSNNSISYIDPAAFNDMPNLSLIELDGNKLKTWNTDWFTNTPNVEHLSMDSNQLQRLPANAFKKLRNYYSTSIRLSNNQIVYIHPTAFEGLNLLYALWLDNNHISDLNDEVFRYFDRIYVLSLSGNELT